MRRKTPEERTEAFQQITRRLQGNREEIKTSEWAGLTELTNKNGAFCADSVSAFWLLEIGLILMIVIVADAGLVFSLSDRSVPGSAEASR
jgi:hypothetical protein